MTPTNTPIPYYLYISGLGGVKKVERLVPVKDDYKEVYWFEVALDAYLKYIDELPHIPVHDDLKKVWKDGGHYYEGKDFKLDLTLKKKKNEQFAFKPVYVALPLLPDEPKPQHQGPTPLINALKAIAAGNDRISAIIAETALEAYQPQLTHTSVDDLLSDYKFDDLGQYTFTRAEVKSLMQMYAQQPQPAHTSGDDLIKELGDKALYQEEKHFLQNIISPKIRELLAGKIITTPETVENDRKCNICGKPMSKQWVCDDPHVS